LTPVASPDSYKAEVPINHKPAIVASGQFNVFNREQFRTNSLTHGRREYYKVALLTGSSSHNYA
jgi:hypothetical protein